MNDILPVTYVVEGVPSSSFEEFERLTQGEKDSIWIVKPGEDSNRGNGIFLCRYNDIKRKIVKLTSKPKSYIIQKYLSKLMLYNGRKFDIRVYVLAISVMGVTKFFWYNEGYLRTSSEQYNLNDLDNLFVHLTNDAIQAQGNTYGLHEPGNKLTYNDLQRYLDANYLKMKYNVVTLVEQMKDVARLAIMATYAKINPVPK